MIYVRSQEGTKKAEVLSRMGVRRLRISTSVHNAHTHLHLLPFITIQFKLSTKLPLPDSNGASLVLGAEADSMLLVPFKGTALPPHRSATSNPFTDLSDHQAVLEPWVETPSEYTHCVFNTPYFPRWEDLTSHILARDDRGTASIRPRFVMALRGSEAGRESRVRRGEPVIAFCDERFPVPWKDGRVVLIGDAVHAMPRQACVLRTTGHRSKHFAYR